MSTSLQQQFAPLRPEELPSHAKFRDVRAGAHVYYWSFIDKINENDTVQDRMLVITLSNIMVINLESQIKRLARIEDMHLLGRQPGGRPKYCIQFKTIRGPEPSIRFGVKNGSKRDLVAVLQFLFSLYKNESLRVVTVPQTDDFKHHGFGPFGKETGYLSPKEKIKLGREKASPLQRSPQPHASPPPSPHPNLPPGPTQFPPGASVRTLDGKPGRVHSTGTGKAQGLVKVCFARPLCVQLVDPKHLEMLRNNIRPEDVCQEVTLNLPGPGEGLGLQYTPSMTVVQVFAGSPAQAAGMGTDRRILAINHTPVTSEDDAHDVLSALSKQKVAQFPILLSEVLEGEDPFSAEEVEELQEALTQTRLMLRDVHDRLETVTKERNDAVKTQPPPSPPRRAKRLEEALGELLLEHIDESPQPAPRRRKKTREEGTPSPRQAPSPRGGVRLQRGGQQTLTDDAAELLQILTRRGRGGRRGVPRGGGGGEGGRAHALFTAPRHLHNDPLYVGLIAATGDSVDPVRHTEQRTERGDNEAKRRARYRDSLI